MPKYILGPSKRYSSTPLSEDGELMDYGAVSVWGLDGLKDRKGRICTSCWWYRPWVDYVHRTHATCRYCRIELYGNLSSDGSFHDLRVSGRQLTHLEWDQIKEKYGRVCAHCGKPEREGGLTADHAIPVSKGGSSAPDNIQPLCRRCNSRKGTKHVATTSQEKT